jgi:hypothetical protein
MAAVLVKMPAEIPDVPRDMFYCSGFQGQMVDYSIIGFGYRTQHGLKENPEFDFNGF